MDWIRAIFGSYREPPIPSGALSPAERAAVLRQIRQDEAPNDERLNKIERSLYPLMAEAGLDRLRDRVGRRHG